jgi:L-amino acid N-acyltransferase YncA
MPLRNVDSERVRLWYETARARGDPHIFAVENDGRVIGSASLYGNGKVSLWIEQEEQGLGLGKESLRQLITRARNAGMKRLWLEVSRDNRRAIGLYETMGFSVFSRKKGLICYEVVL